MAETYSAGGFVGTVMPVLGFVITAPEPLLDSARFLRLHDQIMRKVMRAVLSLHHKNTLPEHFKPAAKQKYGYQARTEATQRIKKETVRHNIDLIKRGKTKQSMLMRVPPIQISGKATKFLRGTMRYKFPFPVSQDAKDPRHVTMAKMGAEIASWTADEKLAVVEKFAELYNADLKHELATRPRWRKHMSQI